MEYMNMKFQFLFQILVFMLLFLFVPVHSQEHQYSIDQSNLSGFAYSPSDVSQDFNNPNWQTFTPNVNNISRVDFKINIHCLQIIHLIITKEGNTGDLYETSQVFQPLSFSRSMLLIFEFDPIIVVPNVEYRISFYAEGGEYGLDNNTLYYANDNPYQRGRGDMHVNMDYNFITYYSHIKTSETTITDIEYQTQQINQTQQVYQTENTTQTYIEHIEKSTLPINSFSLTSIALVTIFVRTKRK